MQQKYNFKIEIQHKYKYKLQYSKYKFTDNFAGEGGWLDFLWDLWNTLCINLDPNEALMNL